MSESLSDLLATDADLDLIAFREFDGSDDGILAGLAALAVAVDEAPVPQPQAATVRPQINRAHKGGLALTVTVGLLLSSSGVAAAVCGNPLAPLSYVAKHVLAIGPHGRGQLPGWDVEGSRPVSQVQTGDAPSVHVRILGAGGSDTTYVRADHHRGAGQGSGSRSGSNDGPGRWRSGDGGGSTGGKGSSGGSRHGNAGRGSGSGHGGKNPSHTRGNNPPDNGHSPGSRLQDHPPVIAPSSPTGPRQRHQAVGNNVAQVVVTPGWPSYAVPMPHKAALGSTATAEPTAGLVR